MYQMSIFWYVVLVVTLAAPAVIAAAGFVAAAMMIRRFWPASTGRTVVITSVVSMGAVGAVLVAALFLGQMMGRAPDLTGPAPAYGWAVLIGAGSIGAVAAVATGVVAWRRNETATAVRP